MEKNTKILIGVGIAAVAAYFVYRSKSKAKTQTGGEAQTGGKGKCPKGFYYVQLNCIKAPCGGECVPMDMMPEKPEPSTEPSRGGKLFGTKPVPKFDPQPEYKLPKFDPTKFGYGSIDVKKIAKEWEQKNRVFADDIMPNSNYYKGAELQQA